MVMDEAGQPRPSLLIVMNGDLLTRTNFDDLLKFHSDQRAAATMAVREYDLQVPYGVVSLDGSSITSIEEKPVQRFFVNAGIRFIEEMCKMKAFVRLWDQAMRDR